MLVHRKPSICKRNLNFWHLGGRVQKLGAHGPPKPPKLYAVNFSRGLVLYTSVYGTSVAHRMSHQADGYSKIDQVQKCFCKVWRSIENVRVDWGDHFWRYLGDSRTYVQDRQNYSVYVQQLARRMLSISAKNRNFSCLGAPVLKLGATWASTTIRHKVSWWTRTITANTYRIPRIHYEPSGRRAFKNRLSPNVFMQSLAFHRNLWVSFIWVIFIYL